MEPLEKFRQETREWLEANCPPSMRTPITEDEAPWGGRNATFKNPETKIWMDRMAAKGWIVPHWPKEFGGGGLSQKELIIFHQEMDRIHARTPLSDFGITMLGPAMLQFGNEAQKKEHLPKIARGEIRWCQGYSEPGAGSDLAGLQTKAEDKGDHYLVNGQKIWTSYAHKADWIFCLVRTNPTAKKHEGISFLLFDMKSPGVEARPIVLISGASIFCETFFTDVKVPKENLMGELNKGWTIAKHLLTHERDSIGQLGSSDEGGPGDPIEMAFKYIGVENGKIANPAIRNRVAQHYMDLKSFTLGLQRSMEESKVGQGTGAASSFFKYYGTELNKRRYETLLEIMGTQGLGWEGDSFSEDERLITRSWLRSKANSIEGGTSEVQLNIIAKRVLGLPD
jgi:alkylation response protein AidB-like acyl-CoA dehydrogenase